MAELDKVQLNIIKVLTKNKLPKLPIFITNIISILYFFIVIKDIFKYNYLIARYQYKKKYTNLKKTLS